VIDDKARTTSRSGNREGPAPLVCRYYTAFFVSCKVFPRITGTIWETPLMIAACAYVDGEAEEDISVARRMYNIRRE